MVRVSPGRLGMCRTPSRHHTGLWCALRALCRRSRGARSPAVRLQGAMRAFSRRQVICGAPSRRHAGALGAPSYLRYALKATCRHSRGAFSSAVCPQGDMSALSERQVTCSAPSGRHTGALGAPGHRWCTRRAPYWCSWSTRSCTARPYGAMQALLGHQVICLSPPGCHTGAPSHMWCALTVPCRRSRGSQSSAMRPYRAM